MSRGCRYASSMLLTVDIGLVPDSYIYALDIGPIFDLYNANIL